MVSINVSYFAIITDLTKSLYPFHSDSSHPWMIVIREENVQECLPFDTREEVKIILSL